MATTNIDRLAPPASVGGYAIQPGDRVLCTAETDGANGIYGLVGGRLVRAIDYLNEEGQLVTVLSGTYAGHVYSFTGGVWTIVGSGGTPATSSVFTSCADVRARLGDAAQHEAITVKNRGIFYRTTSGAGTDTGTELTRFIEGGTVGFIVEVFAYTNFAYIGPPPYAEGCAFWNGESYNVYTEFSDVTIQLGEEEQILIVNDENSGVLNGQVAYASGAQGQRLATKLFTNGTSSAGKVLGLYTHNIAAHQNGRLTTFGLVRDLNTNGFSAVAVAVFSSASAGGLTETVPPGDVEGCELGLVVQKHPTEGSIFVRVKKLDRLSGTTANRPTNNLRVGQPFFDSTLGIPIWCKSLGPTVWVNSAGTTV